MDALKEILGSLSNPVGLLPDLNTFFTNLVPVIRFAVVLGPLVMLALGLCYLFIAPKEANHSFGFRCWWGMASVEVWQFTQRLAGITWIALGGVLAVLGLFGGMGYGAMAPDVMLMDALEAILWQLVLVIISIVGINLTLILLFDSRGQRRGSIREVLK